MIGICWKEDVCFMITRNFSPFKTGIFRSKKITSGMGIKAPIR